MKAFPKAIRLHWDDDGEYWAIEMIQDDLDHIPAGTKMGLYRLEEIKTLSKKIELV